MLKLSASSSPSFADLIIREVADTPPSDHFFIGLHCTVDAQRFRRSRSIQILDDLSSCLPHATLLEAQGSPLTAGDNPHRRWRRDLVIP